MTTRLPLVTAVAFTLGGMALALIFSFAGTEGDPEGFGSAMGVAAPVVGGGLILAMAIGRDHRWLIITTGVVLTLICLIYYVLIPLIVLTLYVIGKRGWAPQALDEAVVGLWAAAGIGVPSAVLLFRETPATWATETTSGGSSDIVTSGEATFSIVLVVLVVVTTLAWSRARA